MASGEFDANTDAKRPTVQKLGSVAEKLVLEACCLELMATDAIVSIQDMGAAGLTCRPSRWRRRAGWGSRKSIWIRCRCAETKMSAYEIMLSESQERMLMVLKPGCEAKPENLPEVGA